MIKAYRRTSFRYDFIRENHEKEINFSFKFVSQEGKDKKKPHFKGLNLHFELNTIKLMEWPNYISNRADRLISNFLHSFLKIFFYYLGSIILPLFVANYFVSIDQIITRSSINFNAMVKSVIIFLIILYIQELAISKLLSKLCQSFQIKLFTDNEISFLKLFWIFINSILVISIIGIKDSLFEYIWAFILKGSVKDKIVIKFAYDILIVILQCISIVFTSSIITLEKCYKSRLINQINQKKF